VSKTGIGRIAFIGGGQMAQALAAGAIEAQVLTAGELVFAEPSAQQQSLLRELFPGCLVVESSGQVLELCDRIVLSVKPQVLKKISEELASKILERHVVVSIAAGISLSQLRQMLGTDRVIRVMPNTPAQVRAGAAAISADENMPAAEIRWVEQLMGAVGSVVRIPDSLMHAVTAVSGSGPAYIYLVIEALSDGGVAAGLSRDIATRLAAQTVLGAARMVLDTGLHPGQLKDQVTSPGGTTIAALRQLEGAGVRSAFIEAVVRSAERSEQLS
jgi:pyrroline-5-carboxylate reductase